MTNKITKYCTKNPKKEKNKNKNTMKIFPTKKKKKEKKNYITLNTNCFHNLTQKRGLKNSRTPKNYKDLGEKNQMNIRKTTAMVIVFWTFVFASMVAHDHSR